MHASLARRFLSHEPDFVLNTGDLVSEGNAYCRWEPEFFSPLEGVIDRVPFALVRGNHEALSPHYETFFMPPDAKPFYSFRWGPVLVAAVGLSTTPMGSTVDEWLDATLAEATDVPWKVFTRHIPLASVRDEGGFDGDALRRWGPLFERHGVDIVFTGHDHFYARSIPLSAQDGGRGIVHIITAGGGAPLYDGRKHAWVDACHKTHHFCVVTASRTRLEVKAIDDDGDIIDTLSLDQGRPPVGKSWESFAGSR